MDETYRFTEEFLWKISERYIMSSQLSPLLPLPATVPDLAPSARTIETSHTLGRLSRRTRQIFLLSRLDGLPYAEIARFLDVDVAKVERAMVRVLRQAHGRASDSALDGQTIQEQASRWYVHLQSPSATANFGTGSTRTPATWRRFRAVSASGANFRPRLHCWESAAGTGANGACISPGAC